MTFPRGAGLTLEVMQADFEASRITLSTSFSKPGQPTLLEGDKELSVGTRFIFCS